MFPAEVRENWLVPESAEQLAEFVRAHLKVNIPAGGDYRVIPAGRGRCFYPDENRKLVPELGPKPEVIESPSKTLLLDKLDSIIFLSLDDQLVSVQSGILLSDLNTQLRKVGFEIPIGLCDKDQEDCVGDFIAMNLPHWNMAKGGSWRDWVVKMKIVLANGEIVNSGANVVKNVTGFDLHKLMIGARSTLGVIAEVTLRIKPYTGPRDFPPIKLQHGEMLLTNPEGLKAAMEYIRPMIEVEEGEYVMEHYVDQDSCLLLTESLHNSKDGTRFDDKKYGHIWRSHTWEYALAEFSDAEQKLMKRTKQIFDPTNKLNPGVFGFI